MSWRGEAVKGRWFLTMSVTRGRVHSQALSLSPVHLIIVLVVAFLILGPGKLPETGAALGKAVHDFRHGLIGDIATTSAGTAGAAGTDTPPTAIPPPSAQ